MTILLDQSNENGLAPGGLGFDTIKIPANASLDASVKKNGSYGCRLTSNGSGGPYRSKTANVGLLTGSVYYTPKTAFGTGAVAMIRGFIAAGSPGKWLQISQKNSGKLSPSIVSGGSSTTGADSTTTLVIGTQYLIDYRFDCSGTTWALDYRISDTSGTVLFTAAQITLAGQVASVMLELREGPDGSTNYDIGTDDHRLTDQSADYPIGVHASNDTEPPGTSVFPAPWLDEPARKSGGLITGFNCPYNGIYPAPYIPVFTASEGATKANRKNYVSTIDYPQCAPPANLYAARQMMNGNLFGDPRVPIISGLGFDGFTIDWPALGCAAFTSGSMDSVLDSWVALFLTLPNWPFVFRLWREMNSTATIYGAHGSTISPHAGVNETSGPSGSYVTAYRYVSNYLRSRVPNLRMGWCPQTGDGFGGLATTSALAAWYPGDAYVDVNLVNAYVSSPSRTIAQAVANFVAGFGMTSGSVSNKPAILCETQVDPADTTRISDLHLYTPGITSVESEFVAAQFWDGSGYPINDSPSGYLSAFQSVVGAAPFDGVPGGDGVFAEITWTDGPGTFIIGTSKLGGADGLGGSFVLDNWTDITTAVESVSISRGRQDATSPIQASTCTITVVDTTGKYNPANQAGTLYGLLTPSRPMRVYAVYGGVTYNLWTGVTSEIVAAPSRHDPFASISGVDLLERLSQEEPNVPLAASTTTGAAIGMVLDAVGWFSSRRSLASGDPIINFSSASGQAQTTVVAINGVITFLPQSVKALDLITQLLDHEGGIFFVDKDGNAVYQDFVGETSVAGNVSSTNLITPGVSIDTTYNRAEVTAGGGVPQEYIDGTSASKYGPRDVPNSPITAQWLPDDAAAAALAARLVIINETEPVWGLTLQRGDLTVPANQALYTSMISLDLGDLIGLNDTGSGTVGNCTIEGINHTIQAGGLDFTTTWVLRLRTSGTFVIGHSVLGGTDTLG